MATVPLSTIRVRTSADFSYYLRPGRYTAAPIGIITVRGFERVMVDKGGSRWLKIKCSEPNDVMGVGHD